MFYKLIFVDVNIVDIVKEFVGFECRLVIIYIWLYIVCIMIYFIVIL